jgi:hypothetical protein
METSNKTKISDQELDNLLIELNKGRSEHLVKGLSEDDLRRLINKMPTNSITAKAEVFNHLRKYL